MDKIIEPKVEVTRAKAAKSLVFCFMLTQPMGNESQLLPNGNQAALTQEIQTVNTNAPTVPIK